MSTVYGASSEYGTNKVLKGVGLGKTYKKREVVSSVSVSVENGEIVGLLGPNGAGKTTTFYMIVGLVTPDKGEIWHGDENISNLPMFKRAQKGIAYLPQEASVFRKLTVEENILAVVELLPKYSASKKLQMERVDQMIAELELDRVRKSLAISLSGGERRRVEIARALATEPSFILLDEPFAGIDPIVVAEIQNVLFNLKKKNIGILITDHNVRETLGVCDRVYILSEGKILLTGDPEAIASSELARKHYLGDNFRI